MTRRNKSDDYEIAYICDGEVPKCCMKPGCYYGKPVNGIKGPCMHTREEAHAKNGKCKGHPRLEPDRFERIRLEGYPDRYYERLTKA